MYYAQESFLVTNVLLHFRMYFTTVITKDTMIFLIGAIWTNINK